MSERCFPNVSNESSLVLELLVEGEGCEGVLSEQILVFALLSEGSLDGQRSVKVLCFLDLRVRLTNGSSGQEFQRNNASCCGKLGRVDPIRDSLQRTGQSNQVVTVVSE